jgi:tetratricopeptide (TPR) repeat protein
MPAHIDLRLGRYAEACRANELAAAADERHARRFPRAGFYRLYMAHNHHFLSFAEMMRGNRARALAAARAMLAGVPEEFVTEYGPVIDGYLPIELHVLVRFGAWREVLAHEPFPAQLKVANALRRYARGTALAALRRTDEAEREHAELVALIAQVPPEQYVGNSPARDVLGIARDMLAGEIALRRGRVEEGLELLRAAAVGEDALRYDEPPDWMMPVRHALGAALVVHGRYAEAEEVYRADLARFPDNGWSLYGLARALDGRGATDEAAATRARLRRAWRDADVVLRSSSYCQADV